MCDYLAPLCSPQSSGLWLLEAFLATRAFVLAASIVVPLLVLVEVVLEEEGLVDVHAAEAGVEIALTFPVGTHSSSQVAACGTRNESSLEPSEICSLALSLHTLRNDLTHYLSRFVPNGTQRGKT